MDPKVETGSHPRPIRMLLAACLCAICVSAVVGVSAANASSKAIPGTHCTATASGPAANFKGSVSCSRGSYKLGLKTCIQSRKGGGPWITTSTCEFRTGVVHRGGGIGVSSVGFHEACNRSYRTVTIGVANRSVAVVATDASGETCIGGGRRVA